MVARPPGLVTASRYWIGGLVVLIRGAAQSINRIADREGSVEFAGSAKGEPR